MEDKLEYMLKAVCDERSDNNEKRLKELCNQINKIGDRLWLYSIPNVFTFAAIIYLIVKR